MGSLFLHFSEQSTIHLTPFSLLFKNSFLQSEFSLYLPSKIISFIITITTFLYSLSSFIFIILTDHNNVEPILTTVCTVISTITFLIFLILKYNKNCVQVLNQRFTDIGIISISIIIYCLLNHIICFHLKGMLNNSNKKLDLIFLNINLLGKVILSLSSLNEFIFIFCANICDIINIVCYYYKDFCFLFSFLIVNIIQNVISFNFSKLTKLLFINWKTKEDLLKIFEKFNIGYLMFEFDNDKNKLNNNIIKNNIITQMLGIDDLSEVLSPMDIENYNEEFLKFLKNKQIDVSQFKQLFSESFIQQVLGDKKAFRDNKMRCKTMIHVTKQVKYENAIGTLTKNSSMYANKIINGSNNRNINKKYDFINTFQNNNGISRNYSFTQNLNSNTISCFDIKQFNNNSSLMPILESNQRNNGNDINEEIQIKKINEQHEQYEEKQDIPIDNYDVTKITLVDYVRKQFFNLLFLFVEYIHKSKFDFVYLGSKTIKKSNQNKNVSSLLNKITVNIYFRFNPISKSFEFIMIENSFTTFEKLFKNYTQQIGMYLHDFKNPLISINESIRDYKDEFQKILEESQAKAIIPKIEFDNNLIDDFDFLSITTNDCIGMIKAYEDFTKSIFSEDYKMTLNFSLFKLYEITSYIQSWMNMKILTKQKKDFVTFKVDTNMFNRNYSIYSDSLKIKQILINILSNSFKFTDVGEIKLSITREIIDNETYLKFEIQDTGIGMDMESTKKLFDPFYSQNNGRNKEGCGLGMVISMKMSKCLGIEKGIQVQSELGKGTRMWFYVLEKQHQEDICNNNNEDINEYNEEDIKGKNMKIILNDSNGMEEDLANLCRGSCTKYRNTDIPKHTFSFYARSNSIKIEMEQINSRLLKINSIRTEPNLLGRGLDQINSFDHFGHFKGSNARGQTFTNNYNFVSPRIEDELIKNKSSISINDTLVYDDILSINPNDKSEHNAENGSALRSVNTNAYSTNCHNIKHEINLTIESHRKPYGILNCNNGCLSNKAIINNKYLGSGIHNSKSLSTFFTSNNNYIKKDTKFSSFYSYMNIENAENGKQINYRSLGINDPINNGNASSFSVLVVDDDEFNIKSIKRLLTQLGVVNVSTMSDGFEIFCAFLNNELKEFELILLDNYMSYLSGYDVIKVMIFMKDNNIGQRILDFNVLNKIVISSAEDANNYQGGQLEIFESISSISKPIIKNEMECLLKKYGYPK